MSREIRWDKLLFLRMLILSCTVYAVASLTRFQDCFSDSIDQYTYFSFNCCMVILEMLD